MIMQTEFTQELQKVMLKRLRYYVVQHISNQIVKDNISLDVTMDRMSTNFILRLSLDIWSEKIEEKIYTVSYPRTWWDHFKQDVIPNLSRLYGMRLPRKIHKFIKFERTAVFPKFNQYSHGPTAEFVIHESVDFRTLKGD